MSNRQFDQGGDGGNSVFALISRRWSGDARLGPLLAAADGALVIVDEAAGRLLYASAGASGLGAGIAEPDGVIDPALSLAAQIGRARSGTEQPALARIQFDRRRIQPPATCLVARAEDESGRVIALILTSRPPRLRPLGARVPEAGSAVGSAPPMPAAPPQAEQETGLPARIDGPARFTWRSGGDDRIAAIAGPAAGLVRSAMAGRSWQDLAASRVLTDAEGMLAALAGHRTFRAISLILRRPGTAEPLELELSGAPLARTGQPFAGFGGFGLVRVMAVGEPGYDLLSVEDEPDRAAPDLVPAETGDGIAPADRASPGADDPHLTGDEHDAFREIARALGVRFAGDRPPGDGDARDGPGGDVMPFPGPAARSLEVAVPVEAEPGPRRGDPVALLDRLPAGILILRDGIALFANPRFLALAGFDDLADIAAAGGFARLFHGLAADDLTRAHSPVLLARREGGSLPVSVTRASVEWDGAPADLLLVNEAEADHAHADGAAARVAQDFAIDRAAVTTAILDSLDDGVLTLDAEGRVLSLNRRAAHLFGLDPREVVGGGIGALFTPASAAAILAALSEPEPAGSPARIVRPSGGHPSPPLALRLHRLRQGIAGGAVLVLREERAAPEPEGANAVQAAEAASALRSDVLAKISHEIRTPLNGILGFTDAMLSEQFGPFENERYRDCLHDIRESGEHVLSVVDDLAEIAGIEAGRRDLAFTEVPLNEIVSHCVAVMQSQAARDRIVIRTSFSQNLTRLVADERSVRRAALNVIANAIRFTEAGGQVIVSTTMADRGEIALRVRDTGIGMTPDEIEVALKPYSISANIPAMSVAKGGTGLGLPLTKALVEANRGRFRITSRKDEGTLVEMLFPAGEAMSA